MNKSISTGMLLAGLVLLSGCGGAGSGSSSQLPEPTVQYFNVITDSTAISDFRDDVKVASSLGYLASTPDFVSFDHTLESDGGTDITFSEDSSTSELDRDSQIFQQNSDYIVLTYGKEQFGTENLKRPAQTVMQVNRRIATGKARLFIMNCFVPKAGVDPKNLDLRTVDPANPNTNTAAVFSRGNLAFGSYDQAANVLDMDAGTWTFQARATDSDAVEVIAQKQTTLAANQLYLVLVTGQQDASDATRQPQIAFIPFTSKP